MGASAAHTWECGSWIWDEADSTAVVHAARWAALSHMMRLS